MTSQQLTEAERREICADHLGNLRALQRRAGRTPLAPHLAEIPRCLVLPTDPRCGDPQLTKAAALEVAGAATHAAGCVDRLEHVDMALCSWPRRPHGPMRPRVTCSPHARPRPRQRNAPDHLAIGARTGGRGLHRKDDVMPDSIPHGSRLHGVIEAAELLGMTRQGFKDAGQPEPDVWIGDTRGWTTETLREWDRTRPRRRTITDEKRARIVQMYRDGYSIAQTAEECGISKASVTGIRAAEKQ